MGMGLRVAGAVIGVAGITMLVIGLTGGGVPWVLVSGSAIFAALILLVVGAFMPRVPDKRLRTEGAAGTARLLAFRDTHARHNEGAAIELDLMVTVPGNDPYQVSVVNWIEPLVLYRLREGVDLAVRVDPGRPDQVLVMWELDPAGQEQNAVPVALAEADASPERRPRRAARRPGRAGGGTEPMTEAPRLLTTGMAAVAEVVETEDLHEPQGVPALLIRLHVRPPGRRPYHVSTRVAFTKNPDKRTLIQPGAVLPVRIDPTDQSKIVLDL